MLVKSEKMALHVPFWTIFPTGTPIAFFLRETEARKGGGIGKIIVEQINGG